ncbi:efflux RND transporter permease subunit, partial [Rhodopseudomonas sp. B29]|uniref:efflux RND transporter permease subunit n=1 Tax=Rhodopseudomonas sp. B29 TaxID=95607 RepID=UPI0004CF7CB7
AVGLLPAALSSGIGSQVQKPLAIVVVAGMMLAPGVILITLPVLISYFSRRQSGFTPPPARVSEPSTEL